MTQSKLSVIALMLFATGPFAASAAAQSTLQTLPALPDGTLPVWSMREDGRTFTYRASGRGYRLRDGIIESNPQWYASWASSDDGEVWAYLEPNGFGGSRLMLNDRGTQRFVASANGLRIQYISGDGSVLHYSRQEQSFSDWFYDSYATTPGGPTTSGWMHDYYGSGESGGTWPIDFRTSYNGRSTATTWQANRARVFLWQEGSGGVPFGPPPRPEPPATGWRLEGSSIKALSRDGRVLVGWYEYDFGWPRIGSGNFVYTREGGTVWAPAALTAFMTNAVSLTIPGDARYVLRTMSNGTQSLYRFQDQAVMSLTDLLTQEGVDLTNWSNLVTTTWSIDGRVISGTGTHQFAPGQFRTESWFVTIPSPSACVLACASLLIASRRRR